MSALLSLIKVFFIHTTYEINENLICHLCGIAIPVNIFRGAIDGNCNPLALQIDHVIPKFSGGTDDPTNLRPSHAFCNGSKNKFAWSSNKCVSARRRISKLLEVPLDEIWTLRSIDGVCIFDNCEMVSRAGDFWQYCVRHARLMGEDLRTRKCKNSECNKNARSKGSGFCVTHAKDEGIIPSNTYCEEANCFKQVQWRFSKKFCQSHCRERNLAHEIEPGVRDKAAHAARHRLTPSHGCYFCVEVDQSIEYFKLSQIDENDKNLSVRRLSDKYKLSAKPAEHFSSLLKNAHVEGVCRWCELLKSLNSKLYRLIET